MRSKGYAYIIVAAVQVIIITIFIVGAFIVLKNEAAALNPVPYLLPAGAGLILLDTAIVLLVLRKHLTNNKTGGVMR